MAIGPELQRYRDDLVAGVALEQRGDGAVDAAAHGDEDPWANAAISNVIAGGDQTSERAVKGVGGQIGGVARLRAETAELGGYVAGADAGGVDDAAPFGERGGCGGGGAGGGAALCVVCGCAD